MFDIMKLFRKLFNKKRKKNTEHIVLIVNENTNIQNKDKSDT